MKKIKVPFFIVGKDFQKDEKAFQRSLSEIFSSGHFILGENVLGLEKKLSALCKTKYAIGVASGSDALWLSLLALGIGSGDEVITTPYTFIATVTAILKVGAKPVFVDIEKDGFSIDPKKISQAVSSRTKAIIPVHLFGVCTQMEELLSLAQAKKIEVIEDAAQSLGAVFKGKPSGSMGRLSALSFYPTKNLGGAGDGGMVLTNDEVLAKHIQMLRAHGASQKYYHEIVGWNSRLDEIQAAILLIRLKKFQAAIKARRKIAQYYLKTLKNTPLQLPHEPKGFFHTYNQFVIRTSQKDLLRNFLSEKGIGTEIYYPMPLHLQPCLSSLGYHSGDFPNAEKAARESLALPIFPSMTSGQVQYVVKNILDFHKRAL